MAAARPRMTEDPDDDGRQEAGTPPAFRRAVEALDGARTRPEVQLSPMPAPKRLAPHAYALEASVGPWDASGERAEEDQRPDELADGRFVLLHDPSGQDSWRGTFRVVTLTRSDLEPEMAGDPLLPEVTWSWLTGALEAHAPGSDEPSGTVTRSDSHFFGGLSAHRPQTELEIRASWTPRPAAGRPEDAVPDLVAHLTAWCELLCQCAGLPPQSDDAAAVVQLPQRRGPRPV